MPVLMHRYFSQHSYLRVKVSFKVLCGNRAEQTIENMLVVHIRGFMMSESSCLYVKKYFELLGPCVLLAPCGWAI